MFGPWEKEICFCQPLYPNLKYLLKKWMNNKQPLCFPNGEPGVLFTEVAQNLAQYLTQVGFQILNKKMEKKSGSAHSLQP